MTRLPAILLFASLGLMLGGALTLGILGLLLAVGCECVAQGVGE